MSLTRHGYLVLREFLFTTRLYLVPPPVHAFIVVFPHFTPDPQRFNFHPTRDLLGS